MGWSGVGVLGIVACICALLKLSDGATLDPTKCTVVFPSITIANASVSSTSTAQISLFDTSSAAFNCTSLDLHTLSLKLTHNVTHAVVNGTLACSSASLNGMVATYVLTKAGTYGVSLTYNSAPLPAAGAVMITVRAGRLMPTTSSVDWPPLLLDDAETDFFLHTFDAFGNSVACSSVNVGWVQFTVMPNGQDQFMGGISCVGTLFQASVTATYPDVHRLLVKVLMPTGSWVPIPCPLPAGCPYAVYMDYQEDPNVLMAAYIIVSVAAVVISTIVTVIVVNSLIERRIRRLDKYGSNPDQEKKSRAERDAASASPPRSPDVSGSPPPSPPVCVPSSPSLRPAPATAVLSLASPPALDAPAARPPSPAITVTVGSPLVLSESGAIVPNPLVAGVPLPSDAPPPVACPEGNAVALPAVSAA